MCGLWAEKTTPFFYSGKFKPQRSWVNDFRNQTGAIIDDAPNGRNALKETGLFDYQYYEKLKQTKVALAPDGDFHWTYRFLEAVMCGAIPLVKSVKEQEIGYHICKVGEDCVLLRDDGARQQAVWHNWKVFIQRHSLLTADELDGLDIMS